MDQIFNLKVPLTRKHVQLLEAKATDVNLPLDSYVQRVLQNSADPSMGMPNSIARQISLAGVRAANVGSEIAVARRAYESVDGQDSKLAMALRDAAVSSTETLDELRRVVSHIV